MGILSHEKNVKALTYALVGSFLSFFPAGRPCDSLIFFEACFCDRVLRSLPGNVVPMTCRCLSRNVIIRIEVCVGRQNAPGRDLARSAPKELRCSPRFPCS